MGFIIPLKFNFIFKAALLTFFQIAKSSVNYSYAEVYQPLPSSISTGAIKAAAERRQKREIQNDLKLEKVKDTPLKKESSEESEACRSVQKPQGHAKIKHPAADLK